MFIAQHHAYCGMSGIPHEFDERTEARSYIARRLRRYRAKGFPVETLEKGAEWKIQEPEDCCMVPDECGTLTLTYDATHVDYDEWQHPET